MPADFLPEHAFAPEFLAHLAERDEPVTAAEADFAIPWHIEPFPKEPEDAGPSSASANPSRKAPAPSPPRLP